MQSITLKAPAKINLHLDVRKKRPDGFHDIETIFEKIDLCDQIILKKRKQGIKVFCRHKDVPRDRKNLCFRAAQRLLARAGSSAGVEIRITKRIPVASGLGGGSSDAASVLLGLNKLLGLGHTRGELLEIARQIGTDVPFFILPALRALGRGKGEDLTPLKVKRKNWYILVVPRLKISTRRMYQHPRLTLTKSHRSVKIVLRSLKEGSLSSLNKYSYNSFEPILRKKYKKIQKIKKALKSLGARATLISGSGPCVFGVTAGRKEAMEISKRLRTKGRTWQVIVAKTYQTRSEFMER